MSAYDLVNNIKVVNAVNSAALTDDSSESAAIDTAGFESVTVVAQMAAFTSGAGKISISECDTSDGSFTAVAESDLINAPENMAAAGAVSKVGYRGHKQFIKVKIVKDSAISATVGAVVILGHPHHKAV
jgi:hypothetical protein|nr:MAG TPA: hypothetical protein [Caudoviricetes sp.]